MKNFLILIFLVFLFIGNSYSQDFNAGILGGAVASQVDGDSYAGFNKLGLVAGMFVSRELTSKIDLQLEMKYKQKGSQFSGDKEKGDFRFYKMALSYLEIPLMVKYKYSDFNIEGGLNFAVLMDSKEEDEFGEVIYSNPFEKYEFSPLIGINYQWKKNLSFSVRWSYSLNRIRKAYKGEYDNVVYPHWDLKKPGQYNHSIELVLFYKFHRGI